MKTSHLGLIIAFVGVVAISFVESATSAEGKKKVFTADKGPKTLDVSSYPKEMQENYKIFAVKCVKCHTLARPINTDKTAQEWKLYVKRMMNKPDSGISPSIGKRIYKFLKFRQANKDKLRSSNPG
jgi:hypothetical protein